MTFKAVFYVQGKEGLFLAPDGMGGVNYEPSLTKAVPFLTEEAAQEAVVDYFDGQAMIFKTYKLFLDDLRRN